MKKIQKYLFYLLLFYALLGFLVLPFVVKWQLPKIIEKNTEAKVTLDSIYINPFLFKLKISDISFFDSAEKPLLHLDSFYIDLEFYSLLFTTIKVNKVELDNPVVYVVNNADKTINLLNVFKSSEEQPQQEMDVTTGSPRIILKKLILNDGKILYTDLTQATPFHFSLDRIDLDIDDIDSHDVNSSDGELGLYANLGDGAFLQLKTKVEGMAPLVLSGHIDFEANQLYTEWRYIKEKVNFELADGRASLKGDFSLNLESLEQMKIENMAFFVKNLRIKPKKKTHDIFKLRSFGVDGVEAYPLQQKVFIDEVVLDGLVSTIHREEDGTLDLQHYFMFETSEEKNSSKEAASPWKVVVDRVDLKNIGAKFADATVNPEVTTSIEGLSLFAEDFELGSAKPFGYKLLFTLNDRGVCKSVGSVIQKQLYIDSSLMCQDLNIPHYNPYFDQVLKQSFQKFDLQLDSLLVSTDLYAVVQESNETLGFELRDSQISLNNCKVRKKTTKESLVGFSDFRFEGLDFDLQKEDLKIKNITLNKLKSNLQRYKNGKLNIEDLVVAKPTKKEDGGKQESSFYYKIDQFELTKGKVEFYDKALEKKAKQRVSSIELKVKNIESEKKSWIEYGGSLRINKTGQLYLKGKLQPSPLKQRGAFALKNLSLADLNPYIDEFAYLKIDDGKLSIHGRTEYQNSKTKPDLVVNAKTSLKNFFLQDTKKNSLLFSLNKLDVQDITYELSPDRLYVDQVDIDSFYIDAFIDQNKTLNFSELSKMKSVESIEKEKPKKEPLDIKVVKVNVTNGSAKFTDFSIPLQFQTHIHDVNGELYLLSSKPEETSYVHILGEIDKYGSSSLIGSVNAADPKNYTDLDFHFKNLALNSLSGYSATFAGYKIDSGKLYLDLGYDIVNSQLKGSNKVMINKIVLGEAIEDENITRLPLGFAIGLLEDSEGVIDLNLPVSGDVDAPDFKYGTVVWTAFSNLITKAVTAPFSLLGSMMGLDGEELAYIEFAAGDVEIAPSQREKLDNIAKIMKKRPKIGLAISAIYDKKRDLFALKRQKLIDIVIEKSGIHNLKAQENALTVDLLEDIYSELRDDDGDEALYDKLEKKYKDKELQRVYQKELLGLTISIQNVLKTDLEHLAQQRGEVIRAYLVEEKFIKQERLEKLPLTVVEEDDAKLVKNSLEIKVNQ